MRIAITLTQVPFSRGGAEIHAEALKDQLVARGHSVDIVTVPFKWYPPEKILDCMLAARLTDLTEVNGDKIDLMIAMKFPAYYIPHPNKALWLLHQHRQAYDLFGTELSDLFQTEKGRGVAEEIKRWDDEYLRTYVKRFTNSRNVAQRLKRFNGIDSTALHVPLNRPGDFRPGPFGDYVFYPGRFDRIKRQHLLIDAIKRTPLPLKVVLIGSTDSLYGRELRSMVSEDRELRDRVSILGLVSEEEKYSLYSNCAAVYNGVLDEDYGYVTIEAFYSGKPVITHVDSGGPLEFVEHGKNGWITPASTPALTACLTEISLGRAPLRAMGHQARETILDANLSWDHVISSLLG